ncbi:GGDEF domain-containing protein [Pseudoroseicyclus sp. H15]
MTRFIRILAPQSSIGFAVRFAIFVCAIIGFNLLLKLSITGPAAIDVDEDIILTALVATPFTAFALVLVQQLYRLQLQLADLAGTDMLTGLHNRRKFFELVETRAGLPGGTLLLIDVDHFKRINDTYGHEVGDLCLRAIGRHLRDAVRDGDLVARLGGEEFAIYLGGANAELAGTIAERVIGALEVEAEQDRRIVITSSAGAAEAWPGATMSDLMRAADAALYRAKEEGRARLVFAIGPGPASRAS